MAISVESVVKTNALTVRQEQEGGAPFEHENVAVLFVIIPAHYLIMEICDVIQINLRSIPCGMVTFKKIASFLLESIRAQFSNSKKI